MPSPLYCVYVAAVIHGIAGWFDLEFIGSQESVTLSTAPESAGTHWYQCRLLLKEPLAANKGQSVSGVIKFTANQFFSYDIDLTLQLVGTDIVTHSRINLKDQVGSVCALATSLFIMCIQTMQINNHIILPSLINCILYIHIYIHIYCTYIYVNVPDAKVLFLRFSTLI